MHAASGGGRDSEVPPKRPTPILTITIPSNEEEIRSLSSPESISPLPSSTQDSGGSSPQHPKMRQDTSSPREFKQEFRQVGQVAFGMCLMFESIERQCIFNTVAVILKYKFDRHAWGKPISQ